MHKKNLVGSLFFSLCYKSVLTLIAVLIGAQVFAQALSGDYTINKLLPETDRNFASFGTAALALDKGVSGPVVFTVAPNSTVFEEKVVIYKVKGASTTNTVTFLCNNDTIRFTAYSGASMAGIKLDGAKYITFENLVVNPVVLDQTNYGVGFELLRDADSNTIRKCTVIVTDDPGKPTVQRAYGIAICGSDEVEVGETSYCDGNLITENTIIGGDIGIYVSSWIENNGSYFSTANDNKVTNNTIKDFYNQGIRLMLTHNTLVQGNDISSGRKRTGNGVIGINLTQYSTNCSLLDNRLHDLYAATSQSVINIQVAELINGAGTENLIANNVIFANNASGVNTGIRTTVESRYLNIFHNTLYFNGAGGTTLKVFDLDYTSTTSVANNNFVNNIVSVSGVFTTTQVVTLTQTTKGMNFNRNDYFLSASGTLRYGSINTTRYTTLTAWQAATGYDLLTISQNPLFENTTTGLLRPSEPLLDNRGAYLKVDKDITGANRSNTFPDIGAYEFLSVPCSLPVVPGTTSVLPGTTICEEKLISLDLKGNSAGDKQTYQWVASTTEDGTYTNVGGLLGSPAAELTATSTFYYKALVTCGTESAYSNPVKLTVNPIIKTGVYTIDASQPTGGTNYRSFTDAVNSLLCGIKGPIVFNVSAAAGPYNEQVIIPAIPGSSATNTVTFNGNGATLTFGGTATLQRATLKLLDADHFIFNDLKIAATGTSWGYGIHFMLGADSNIVRRCTITVSGNSSNAYAGIAMSPAADNIGGSGFTDCDNNLIDSCDITGGFYGYSSTASDATPVLRNIVSNCKIKDFGERGIWLQSAADGQILNNDISKPVLGATRNTFGISVNVGSKHMIVSNNKVHDLSPVATSTSDLTGIFIGAADASADAPNLVSNNIIYNLKNVGNQYGINNNGSDYTLIYHNTVSLDYTTTSAARFAYGIYLGPSSGVGAEIKNNIVTLKRKTTTLSYAIFVVDGWTYTSDYNDYYTDAANTFIRTGRLGSVQLTNLDDWKTTSVQDVNSIAVDPAYTSLAFNGDLTPTTTSMNDKGSFVGIKTDITGAKRIVAHPDMGAYEFGCPLFPAADVVNASPSICTGTKATFTIKNSGPDTVYTWYDAAIDGNPVSTGSAFTTAAPLTAPANYWVEAATTAGCSNYLRTPVTLSIIANPATGQVVNGSLSVCTNSTATFNVQTPVTGVVYRWYNVAAAGAPLTTGVSYTTPAVTGVSNYWLETATAEGCTSGTRTAVKATAIPFPVAKLVTDSIAVCTGAQATFNISSPVTGVVYSWYTTPLGGTTTITGNQLITPAVTTQSLFYVEASTMEGCKSVVRDTAKAVALQPIAVAPVASVDTVGVDVARFRWNAVAGAKGYQVSTDGVTFTTPSSGATGLTHTLTGLAPLQTVSLYVKAIADLDCQSKTSLVVKATTLTSTFFIPNMFTPNGDGKNDIFMLYGNGISSSKMMIFNQWGEKVFESSDIKSGWNGSYKGKQMPVGVYIYTVNIVFGNGTTENKKGTFNLIR